MTGTNFTNSYQMTESDIGKGGWNRDGDVLWAPDSKRFAYFSSDLTPGRAGGLREQTAIFQLTVKHSVKSTFPWPKSQE